MQMQIARRIFFGLVLSFFFVGCATTNRIYLDDVQDVDSVLDFDALATMGVRDPVRTQALYDNIGYRPVVRRSRH
jgi:hypothetical protein